MPQFSRMLASVPREASKTRPSLSAGLSVAASPAPPEAPPRCCNSFWRRRKCSRRRNEEERDFTHTHRRSRNLACTGAQLEAHAWLNKKTQVRVNINKLLRASARPNPVFTCIAPIEMSLSLLYYFLMVPSRLKYVTWLFTTCTFCNMG